MDLLEINEGWWMRPVCQQAGAYPSMRSRIQQTARQRPGNPPLSTHVIDENEQKMHQSRCKKTVDIDALNIYYLQQTVDIDIVE